MRAYPLLICLLTPLVAQTPRHPQKEGTLDSRLIKQIKNDSESAEKSKGARDSGISERKESETPTSLEEGVPSEYRLIPGITSPGVTIYTFMGTRWSNLYRDPQARDTFFRPKGFFALENEQYFWLKAHPRYLLKWGGGAMIEGAKESDFKEAGTGPNGLGKAVNSTDTASAHVYVWFGGFLTETTSIGVFLQHQFSNYTQTQDSAVSFADTIRSQRRVGLLIQQHAPQWRGSLVEYSTCQDPLFEDSKHRLFLRGRAMYNVQAARFQALGWYLEGSINRAQHRSIDRDDVTITLGLRIDLGQLWGN